MIINIQGGNDKTKYKEYVLENLSFKLSNEFGRGFSKKILKE